MLGQEEPVRLGLEPTEDDGFIMDMEDHGYDWDDASIHIEDEDICHKREREAEERLQSSRPRPRRNPPAEVMLLQAADMGAGTVVGQNESTGA